MTLLVLLLLVLELTFQAGQSFAGSPEGTLPKGLVYADETIPDLRLEQRYVGSRL